MPYSPNIVTSGLVLALDAADTSSYSGTYGDTTWYDVSGNGYNFTINPGAWSSAGLQSYMNFSGPFGIAKRIVSSALTDVPGGTNGTIMAFTSIKPISHNAAWNSITDWRTLVRGASNDHQVIIQNGTNTIGMYNNEATAGFYSSGFNVTNISPAYSKNLFNCLHWRLGQSSPYYKFGYNTTYSAATITDSNATFNNGFCCVGGLHGASTNPLTASQYWGKIAVFLYYNRQLSDAEILQNINAYSSRYSYNSSYDSTGPVCSVDAANTSSYSGTGVYWNDESGNSNYYTLINSPTWNASGYFTFNGSTTHAASLFSSFPMNRGAGTQSVWARVTTNTGGYQTIQSYGAGDVQLMRLLGLNGLTPYFLGYGDDVAGGSVSLNTWFNLVGVYDGTNATLYLNGSQVATAAKTSWNTGGTNQQQIVNYLGVSPRGEWWWNGNIAFVQVHNRALSGSEVSANFEAQRGRFGI